MSDHPQLRLELNVQGVTAPVLTAMRTSSEIISIAVNALQKVDFSNVPKMDGVFFTMEISSPDLAPEKRRTECLNWLFTKGFQELARGIRQSLEEAFLYVRLIETPAGLTTLAKIQQEILGHRNQANRMSFPDLIATVGEGLREPLAFNAEFLSLQKVRNCLEHRNGIVGAADVDADGLLRLTLPRLSAFLKENGSDQEVEVHGETFVEKGGTLLVKRTARERRYALGDQVTFTPAEFHEIASGCWLFANDLAAKLPIKILGAGSSA